jgi:hypothetical protein
MKTFTVPQGTNTWLTPFQQQLLIDYAEKAAEGREVAEPFTQQRSFEVADQHHQALTRMVRSFYSASIRRVHAWG